MEKIKVLLCIVMAFMLCACDCKNERRYSDHSFAIIIKSDFKDDFQDAVFDLDDFNYENVLTYSYSIWNEKNDTGTIFIFLKETGNKEIDKAIEHFIKLDFVVKCQKIPL